MIRSIFIFAMIFFLGNAAYGQTIKPAFLTDYNKQWVDSVFNSLTLDEKIGQLLLPRGNYSGKPHDAATLASWVRDYKIGGIVFFASNPSAQAALTNELQAISKTPLLIGQDFEWGVGMRLDSTDRFPYAVALGAASDSDQLMESMGREIARQCKRLGVHINYAPVVDVNNNPNNPVINFRSYGSDKEIVASRGLAYMKGMQSQRLLCTAKHFPGHGDTDVDSHHDLPVILHDKTRLKDIELYPFKKLIDNGLSGIMTAHLNIPALEPDQGLASTFSTNIVFQLLREELGFQGLTFTDAMEMQGAVKNFPKGEAMVRALLAGNDILETFMDVPGTVAALKEAVAKGRIPMDVLNDKVRKILMAKSWVGLDQYKPVAMAHLLSDLNTITGEVLNYQLTEKSITCLRNDFNMLPIKDLNQKIAVLSVESEGKSDFYKMVSNYTQVDYYHMPKNVNQNTVNSTMRKLASYDVVLAGIHLIDIRASKNYGITPENAKIIDTLAKQKNVALCILGNPFVLAKIPELAECKTLMMGYQQSRYAENAMAQVIFGALPAEGQLPIGIDDHFKLGKSVQWKSIGRLSYGIPEQVGIERSMLISGIDSIIGEGLKQQAYPGAVVQITKNGKVIMTKAYGYHTYEDAKAAGSNVGNDTGTNYSFIDDAMDNPESLKTTLRDTKPVIIPKGKVLLTDVYDMASVTKISTSTLAVMQLMSEGKFSLDDPLGKYYTPFQGTNKENLKMKDLLTHRAGLKAWIPFWRDAVDSVATLKKALEMNPALENDCIVEIKKPGFFKRLFGKKPTKHIKYEASLAENAQLMNKILTPENRIWKQGIFVAKPTAGYGVKVSDHLFLNDQYKKVIMGQIADSEVKPDQGYVYSDLHYYLYPDMIQSITGKTFESYLDMTYKSLGANSLTFNPLNKFSKDVVVPTEYDSLFRSGLIHGYVHDEGAAMLSGVSGHAGLFGTANDLTKLMQMYLQKGTYGGFNYIKSEVVDECTRYQFPEEKNRRGIGFDKKDFNPEVKNAPSLASDGSYGHSGYTGTYTWIDPENQLVYVFLCNRVYPTRNNNKLGSLNIRAEIGNHIIKSIRNSKVILN
ncbi:MAG: glycoside hydrolase family 3 N-terminal domain-containing protein [Saprospiraceae bacterium]